MASSAAVRRAGMRMIKIDLKVDVSGPLRLVKQELPNAVPYVQATLLTNLAYRVQGKVREQMPVSFDRPTPFTVRGVFVKKAQKDAPVAEVYFPESQEDRGTAKREYMRPGALGTSQRRQKRTEFLLTRRGSLPPGWVTTPGTSAAKYGYMDGFGNVKPTWYRWIVNALQLKQMGGAGKRARDIYARSQKRARKMGVEYEAFAVAPGAKTLAPNGSWLPPGVYRRVGDKGEKLHQILKFVQRAAYKPRIDLEAIARQELAAALEPEFNRAFASVRTRFALRDTARAATARAGR